MKNLKKVLFGCGLTMAMFTACNSGVQPQLTVSGLDPAKFDTLIRMVWKCASQTMVDALSAL